MSIKNQIVAHERVGALIPFAPPDVVPAKRRLFLTENAYREFVDENEVLGALGLRGQVKAAMVRWAKGERVYKEFLKPLDPCPPKTWEIRITAPTPQVRLFGRFAYEDTFIATHFYTRPRLGSRKTTKKGRDQWDIAKSACEDAWKALFPHWEPFTADKVQAYVTENCDDFKL
jgi:hypothetical protein